MSHAHYNRESFFPIPRSRTFPDRPSPKVPDRPDGYGVAVNPQGAGDDRTAVQIADRIARLAHRMRRASMLALEPLGLTPAQSRALRTVARAATPMRMGELAQRMGIVPRSATSLVDALVTDGLLERATDPDNRRVVLVSLSAGGQQVQEKMARARAQAATRILSPLTSDEIERLLVLLDTLETDDDRPPSNERENHPIRPV